MAYTTIDDPSAHFQALTYTGNATNRTLTFDGNSDLQADWFWFKERNASANWHQLYDTSRGIGTSSSKRLFTNDTSAEEETSGSGARGVGTNSVDIGTTAGVNGNTNTLVLWAWKANGGTTSSNTDGSITSTVQANTTAGFSIVTYASGQGSNFSIGHGLSSAPKVIIAKSRTSAHNWGFYYTIRGTNTNWMSLNTTGAQGSNNSDPDANGTLSTGGGYTGAYAISDSSTIKISQLAFANYGTSAVAYCFSEVKGYSKFGSYTGNGSTDGPFVYTGFKPAWLIRKRTDTTGAWLIQDNKRPGSNRPLVNSLPTGNNVLRANDNSAEEFNNEIDILSNGFKCRATDTFGNASGGTYIYMAFAEHPFVSSKGVPVTAR